MFNLSAIMNEAWSTYLRSYSKRPTFQRSTFNWLLMISWKRAKEAALRASNPVMAKVEALCERRDIDAQINRLLAA
ncbi:hypothetical protein ABC425_00995 [Brucella melitensis]|uniref:hypothetical protein n=1 Tax=Brucella melitensis TaxID=29459 RepID=UPI0031FC07A0